MKFFAIFILALASASAFETPVPFSDISLNEKRSSRVFGGQVASDGQFPYQVGLELVKSDGKAKWCGGSLISSTIILTASYCAYENCTSKVSAGVAYLGSVSMREGTSRAFSESAIISHEDYNPRTFENDIALIKISAVPIGDDIQLIPLPARSSSYSTYAGSSVTFSGWGRTSDEPGSPSRLNYAEAVIIFNSECARSFGNVKNGTMCISTQSGTSSCSGDSGGPVVYNKELIGIASFVSSYGCTKRFPAAFARVTYFRDWIYNNSGI